MELVETASAVNWRRAVGIWLSICEREGYPVHAPDVDHSALLNRLLKGKQPLPEPPPLAFSYPWYDLIDNGHSDTVWEVWVPSVEWAGENRLVIDQGVWTIIRQNGPDDWMVTYEMGQGESKRSSLGRWRVFCTGVGSRDRKTWRIEKLAAHSMETP